MLRRNSRSGSAIRWRSRKGVLRTLAALGAVTVAAVLAARASAQTDTAQMMLAANLAKARTAASVAFADAVLISTSTFVGRTAQVVVYSGNGGGVLRVVAVGASPGNTLVREARWFAGVDPSVSVGPLCSVRGDSVLSVIVAIEDPSGGTPGAWLLDLKGNAWEAPTPQPERASCDAERDADGMPALPTALVRENVFRCTSPEDLTFSVSDDFEVTGFEGWDGTRWTKDLRALRPVYERALAAARAEAEPIKARPSSQPECPTEALRVGATIFILRRVLGGSPAEAMREADAVWRGISTSRCHRGEPECQVTSVQFVRDSLLRASDLPTLSRERAAKQAARDSASPIPTATAPAPVKPANPQ